MNILMISNLFPPDAIGGYEILCAQVGEALTRRGHTVTVLTSRPGLAGIQPPEGSDSGAGGVRVRRELDLTAPFGEVAHHSRRRRSAVGRRNAAITMSALREERPDLVFIWSQLRLTVAPARICEAEGVPVCYTMNDGHLAGYRPRAVEPATRALAGAALDRTVFRRDTSSSLDLENVTCISDVVREDLALNGVELPRSRVIHQGIPVERFPLKADPGSIHTPVRLLYAGQLLDYKGPDILLRAAQRLVDLDVEVTVAGRGPFEATLSQLASAVSFPVRFVGSVDHSAMPALYRDHDIFGFTSTWREPFGLTHLEAMASGTPVVSTAEGGQAEFLCDGDNALVVPPGDDRALAGALRRLVDSPELSRRLARRGRETVERRFSLERYVSDLDEWLCRVRDENAA